MSGSGGRVGLGQGEKGNDLNDSIMFAEEKKLMSLVNVESFKMK